MCPREGIHISFVFNKTNGVRFELRSISSLKDLSILQYDVIFLSLDFLRKLRGFSKSFAYVGSVAKGNIG